MNIKRFEDLNSWQEARIYCRTIFSITKKVPFKRDFDLVRQITRSAGSTMDNIAEGFERNGDREFIQFLSIAKASCGESRSQLFRAYDSNYITDVEFNAIKEQSEKVSKLIQGTINYVKKSELKGSKFNR